MTPAQRQELIEGLDNLCATNQACPPLTPADRPTVELDGSGAGQFSAGGDNTSDLRDTVKGCKDLQDASVAVTNGKKGCTPAARAFGTKSAGCAGDVKPVESSPTDLDALADLMGEQEVHERNKDHDRAALEAPIVLLRYRCKWCNRYFVRDLEGLTLYVDAPIEKQVPSDGICLECRTEAYGKFREGKSL